MIIEKGKPLDDSVLWSWIQHYYAQGGVAVWSDGDIPFHITNTPILAAEWARSVFALARDLWNQGELDHNQPVEVFELGPGTGRHAFYLLRELKRLEPLTRAICPQGLRFRVHLAELGASGLDSLSQHPNFQEAFAQGDLVLHQFDITRDDKPKHYFPPGATLGFPSANPVFVVCNYLLDSLPHDVIRVGDGVARLGHTKLSVQNLKKGQEPTQLSDLGERIRLTFSFPKRRAVYPQQHWNQILRHYERLVGETHIPFPTKALQLAERARSWSETAAVFLVADKSFTSMAQLIDLEEPELVPHGGGFSFNANLHAFGYLAQQLGGKVNHTPSRDGTLDLSHVVFPANGRESNDWSYLETDFLLEELERFHAVDRFRTKESVDEAGGEVSLRLALDLLRLTGFDPQVLYELSDDILKGLEGEDEELPEMEDELFDVLPRVLPLVFPLPDEVDAAFEIGRIAYRLEHYELARKAFSLSLEHYGEDPRTYFNLGLTWYYRNTYKRAVEEFERALHIDPDYEEAQKWIEKAKSKLVTAL